MRNSESREDSNSRMSNKYSTSDLIQGKVLAALPWEGGCKTEAVARYAGLSEDTVRRALEDLVKRGMVTIDNRNYWRKKPLD
jgi:DNA-binding transcriptional regulator LsrR (DeoR family)